MQISMIKSKVILATLWGLWATALFFVFFLQTTFGHYGQQSNEAWGWFLPTVVPTLSLIVGVLALDATGKGSNPSRVNRFMFIIAVGLSAVYLLAVTLTVLLQPFAAVDPLALMQQQNLWLSPFQGLVSAAMGVFFVKPELG